MVRAVLRKAEIVILRKIVVVIFAALVVFSGWHYCAKTRRDARYREILSVYRRELQSGMRRAEVRSYLDSKNVQYRPVFGPSGGAWAYEIKIGEEPAYSLVCWSWTVYITFDFRTSVKEALEPLQDDTLKEIRIRKAGTCL